jgi:CBS domain-containing protein
VWLTDVTKAWIDRVVSDRANEKASEKASERSLETVVTAIAPKPELRDPEVDPLKVILQGFRVADVMREMGIGLPNTLSVTDAGLLMTQAKAHSALILDGEKKLVGILTLQDVNRSLARWNSQEGRGRSPRVQTVEEVCSKNVLVAYKDEGVVEAIDRMAARGLHQLPVVDREDVQEVLGMICEDGIDLACNVAMTQEALGNYFAAETVVV